MSDVLKSKRYESKCQFVATAYELYTQTVAFLTRLSARYSRILVPDTMRTASVLMEEASKANAIYISDSDKTVDRREQRLYHLREAYATLSALELHLIQCYDIMMKNPKGCMEKLSGKAKGEFVEEDDAKEKLGKMTQTLGDLINKEDALLEGVIKKEETALKELQNLS